jgi:hypothetical protein
VLLSLTQHVVLKGYREAVPLTAVLERADASGLQNLKSSFRAVTGVGMLLSFLLLVLVALGASSASAAAPVVSPVSGSGGY